MVGTNEALSTVEAGNCVGPSARRECRDEQARETRSVVRMFDADDY
jgi:hypothetical protein